LASQESPPGVIIEMPNFSQEVTPG